MGWDVTAAEALAVVLCVEAKELSKAPSTRPLVKRAAHCSGFPNTRPLGKWLECLYRTPDLVAVVESWALVAVTAQARCS